MSAAAASMNGSTSAASAKASPSSAASSTAKTQPKTSAGGKALDSARKQASSPVDASSSKKPAPKAWQGTNPITQRSTPVTNPPNGVPNGSAKSTLPSSKSSTPAPNPAITDPAEASMDMRMALLVAKFIGSNCIITLRNGEKFSGVFSGASLRTHACRIDMKMVKRISRATSPPFNLSEPLDEFVGAGDDHVMAFDLQDTLDINVSDVQLSSAENKSSNGVGSSFRTDAEISGAAGGRERELQPWVSGPPGEISMALDESTLGTWDQFDTNARLYNVKSDYDENLYTTTINRNDPLYAQREAEARRIAREMERSQPSNPHVAEERRMNSPSNAHGGLDEEDKYSGVRRAVAPLAQSRPNAYVPPSMRPITSQPTVSGAPFDPAIISSQIARPAPPAAMDPDGKVIADQASRAVAAAQVAPSTSSQTSHAPSVPSVTVGTGEVPPTTDKPAFTAVAKGPVEGVERKVLDSFKSFANSEKLKLQNHQRAMQERNRVSARQEKSVKLNDLKKFAENFKLYSRVPDDLVPILAKTKEKQNEIVTKADQQAREKEHKAKTAAPVAAAAAPSKPEVDADAKVTRAAPASARPDAANDATSPFNNRQRMPQNFRGSNQHVPPPRGPGLMNHRMQQHQTQHRQGVANANVPTPISLGDVRSPPSAPSQMREAGLVSPDSAASTRFNVKAMEFRPNPAANTFTPGPGRTSPDGTKKPSVSGAAASPPRFFSEITKPLKERAPYDTAFNAIKQTKEKAKDADEKAQAMRANNGGIPPAYRTPPRWEVAPENDKKLYVEAFPASPATVSPTRTPSIGTMPHQNQLPPHLQQNMPPQMPAAQHTTPRFYAAQPQHAQNQHMDEQRVQYASSNSSVQPSPRMGHPSMAYAGQMHPQMASFAGGMPPYMSPGMPMRPMPSGPQFGPQGPQMGGHMMVQQASNGPFMSGPMGQPMQMYPSPGPGYVQPHFANHAQQPGNYGASPRGHPMSHQGSQQGHQPGQPFMVPPGSQMMMQPHPGQMAQMRNYPQGQYQGGPHGGFNMQHRQMSGGGYNHQMTPRQNHATPHQGPNSGNGPPTHNVGPNDVGK